MSDAVIEWAALPDRLLQAHPSARSAPITQPEIIFRNHSPDGKTLLGAMGISG